MFDMILDMFRLQLGFYHYSDTHFLQPHTSGSRTPPRPDDNGCCEHPPQPEAETIGWDCLMWIRTSDHPRIIAKRDLGLNFIELARTLEWMCNKDS